jgi:hypothetical protein
VLSVRYVKRIVVATSLTVLILGGMFGCGIVASAKQDSALTRCTYRPANDSLYRSGTSDVRWNLFRLSYDCVYRRRDGTVVVTPPP